MVQSIDLDGVGRSNGNLYGLPHTPDEAAVVIIPVPWEVTTSFRGGTKHGPDAILAASPQIDLFDPDLADLRPWDKGIAVSPLNWPTALRNAELRVAAQNCIAELEAGRRNVTDPSWLVQYARINNLSEDMAQALYLESLRLLDQGKIVAVLGGDHSTPLGLMRALSDRHEGMGILHIDAHLDLRDAYEGFRYSHASIMRNAAEKAFAEKFVHVGIRDYCREEERFAALYCGRHSVHTDRELKRRRFGGVPWDITARQIIAELPQDVYVSFDIDGLDPSLCPNTGTPVPGGLQFEEAMYLIERVVESGRKIIGFDLVEVAPASSDPRTWATDWNANVGMRVLYRLSCMVLQSQQK